MLLPPHSLQVVRRRPCAPPRRPPPPPPGGGGPAARPPPRAAPGPPGGRRSWFKDLVAACSGICYVRTWRSTEVEEFDKEEENGETLVGIA